MDVTLLSRIQFGFTVAYHILFPAFTIGLASWLAVVEWRWLATGNKVYEDIYRMWVKIFAVTFGMGVVSGVVLAYQFGTNWSVFSDKVGSMIGPMLAFEVLTAFFLEASFLGIMLFGWDRVSHKMHFAATIIEACGTLLSAFWILSANSWMQTPAGYRIGAGGMLYPTNWLQVIFNPSFPYRFVHMVVAAYLTTAFVVSGVSAYYLWRRRHEPQARVMFGMAMIMAIFVAPLQPFIGDRHGLNTLEHQPAKVSAIEGAWETERGAPLRLFAWPDQAQGRNDYVVKIPKLSSLILTHTLDGEVKGLKAWPRDDWPPVAPVFFAFRVMVGLGILMALTGLIAIVLYFRKRLFETRWFQLWCMALTPAGFIAVVSGWIVTEVGRQPYITYGLIRTADAVSPLLGSHVAATLVAFIVCYTVVFGAGSYYILHLIAAGPGRPDEEVYGTHGVKKPPLITDLATEPDEGGKEGGKHV
jgi:cytochrome d ubiquinol oxidase subunit I